MDKDSIQDSITDSISCLHAIEHFGLGRYGDSIDPNGHIKAFNNILRMLKPGGTLYISFPIANENEVHFNAHRAFHPKDIFTWIGTSTSLKLTRFDYVNDDGDLVQNASIDNSNLHLKHGCGIYTFCKIS
jgi:SAM-dependent methyltransferase